jgi:hypothetical protein
VKEHTIREDNQCLRLLCLHGGQRWFDIRGSAHSNKVHVDAKYLGSLMHLLLRNDMERVVRIPEDGDLRKLRDHLSQERKALPLKFGRDRSEAGDVSAGMSKALDQAGSNGVANGKHHARNGLRRVRDCRRSRGASRHNDRWVKRDKLFDTCGRFPTVRFGACGRRPKSQWARLSQEPIRKPSPSRTAIEPS